MSTKLEALKALLDEAILESRREIESNPSPSKSRRSIGSTSSGGGEGHVFMRATKGGWGEDNEGSLASDEEVIYWKRRFNDLKNNKDPLMKSLESDMLAAFEREDQALSYVRKLESKIERLETKGSDANIKTKELTDKIESRRKRLEIMEWFTGMTIKQGGQMSTDGKEEFVCTVKNAVQKKATRFALSLLLDEEEFFRQRKKRKDSGENSAEGDISAITYIPRANAEMLSEYLQSVLSFEADMAPVLLSDVLGALYEEEEEDGEEDMEE